MTYLYSSPAFYLSQRNENFPKMLIPDQTNLCLDFKSNRITRKAQLIEEESILRRMKAASMVNKAHREGEIAAMRIKYQLQELDALKNNNFHQKISKEAQLIKQDNMMRFAEIEGCRTRKQPNSASIRIQTSYCASRSKK